MWTSVTIDNNLLEITPECTSLDGKQFVSYKIGGDSTRKELWVIRNQYKMMCACSYCVFILSILYYQKKRFESVLSFEDKITKKSNVMGFVRAAVIAPWQMQKL